MKKEKVQLELAGLFPLTETQVKLLLGMLNTDWKPNLSEISRRTGICTSTIHDNWNKLTEDIDIEVSIRIKKAED